MKAPNLDDTTLKLRVWWTTDGLMRLYYVTDPEQAMVVLATLTAREVDDDTIGYNASGLEEFTDNEWTEWYDDEGRDIKEVMDENE